MNKLFKRLVLHPLEAVLMLAAYAAFRLLPASTASAVGGFLGRTFGPHFSRTRRARRNLALTMPELPPAEMERIIRAVWDNLGRIAGEFPHLERLAADPGRVEVVNPEVIDLLRGPARPSILFSGHFANWEVFAAVARARGIPIVQLTRMPNNPLIARVLSRLRRVSSEMLVPKGSSGTRQLFAVLQRGGRLGMLVDQKLNEGIALPFLGREAMTSTGLARLGLRFGCPVVPVQLERVDGCRFRLTLHPPLTLPHSGDVAADTRAIMTQVNGLLEKWIRARPEQWMWLHSRWPE
jgi:KDO2-lipid IV(A) lauroyltransferase